MRSRNISVSIIIQNIAQLKALYEKQWESIMGNCDEFLYLGGNESSTHKLISESYLGKSTLWLDTYGKSTGHSGRDVYKRQPKNRAFVDEILKTLGLSHNDPKGIIDVCKGM